MPFIGVQGFYQSAFAENVALAEEFLLNYVNTPETSMALFEAQPRVPALTEVAEQVADDPIVAGFQAAGEASASAAGGGSAAEHQGDGGGVGGLEERLRPDLQRGRSHHGTPGRPIDRSRS